MSGFKVALLTYLWVQVFLRTAILASRASILSPRQRSSMWLGMAVEVALLAWGYWE